MQHLEIAPLVASLVLSGTGFAQVRASSPVEPPSCSASHRSGRRIVSSFNIVEFYLPHFAKVKKVPDVDYVEYFIRYGEPQDKLWLKFMLGGHLGDNTPKSLRDPSIRWTTRNWGCEGHEDGTDWRGLGLNGQRWRYIRIPFGFASYENVPWKAAGYFDKILDSMCCGKVLP